MGAKFEDIYRRIWDVSHDYEHPGYYDELRRQTRKLIDLFTEQGRLDASPFESTHLRRLSQPYERINPLLKDKVVLVTGGLGCVGSNLVNELLTFEVRQVVIVDKNPETPYTLKSDKRILRIFGDIRDAAELNCTFSQYQPEIVFHTAAQRDPGYAERNVAETVTSNVLGTLNTVRACEQTHSVKQCIFSSTGKASRYFTEEVYAGTKKICENILDLYSRKGRVKYGMVRFTHMLDNSLMNGELKHCAEFADFIGVHSPGKYVTAQNKEEAASLMLNALLYSQEGRANFLLVRNLEWPVESLHVALYYIKTFGRDIPVVFVGNPKGYTEKFFRGQMDWSDPCDLNLLINVYESRNRWFNAEEDIVISYLCRATDEVIEDVIETISDAARSGNDPEIRECLISGLRRIVVDLLKSVDKDATVDILNWGLQPKYLAMEKATPAAYGEIIPMMFASLEGSPQFSRVSELLNPVRPDPSSLKF